MKKCINKKLIIACACFFTAMQLQAQQMPGSNDAYVLRIPTYRWIDDTHYVAYDINSKQDMSTDVLTGESKVVARSFAQNTAKPKIAITRKGDVYLYSDAGVKNDSILNVNNATISPDSARIAYTRNNDLFIYTIADKQEWRVTNDGSKDVYNGKSAWVYNEEIFGRGTAYRAFWWSPDSKHIAFMRFDETNVPIYDHFDDEGVHGKHTLIHYPQPGDMNPEVKVAIANVSNKSLVWADFNSKVDQYFGTPYWTPTGNALWVQWMNRRQDSLKVEAVDPATGSRKNVYTETQKTWVALDQDNRITFIPSKNIALFMSDKSGWMHLYAYSMDGKLIKQLTTGNWTVKELNYIDEKGGWIYFTARKDNSTRTDLYKVNFDGSKLQRLTFGDYSHRFVLSPTGKYFITTYSNFATPAKAALVDNNGKIIKELIDSKGKEFDKYYAQARKSEIIRVKTPDGFELPVRIVWPAKIDPAKKYPVLANIYGGPDFSFVQDGFFQSYSDDDKDNNLISIQMDHRGSGQFGKMGQDYLYRQLGKWEIEDYTTVIKYLEQKYPFIDTTRIGISGFSYGGYVTSLALCKAPDVFTFGLAGGSVTDWRLYDSPYTERYMGTPQDNPEGYKQANVITYVKNYKGLLRLTQGTMDDNVHMQNTMQLVSALQNASKHFELMFYPGGAHGWLSLHEKYAHYRKEDQTFIDKNLLLKSN